MKGMVILMLVQFAVGEVYNCVGLYGDEYIIEVKNRTDKEIFFVYSESTSDDRSTQKADIITQECCIYDKELNEIDKISVETAVAWKYHSPYAKPDDIDYGYYFSFNINRLWEPAEWFKEKENIDNPVIKEFKNKTAQCFTKIDNMSATQIEDFIMDYAETKLQENNFDAKVINAVISGSRCRGLETAESDLDVVIEIEGNVKEYILFNLLHEDDLKIGEISVDINPITKYETGTLQSYLPKVENYLEEKKAAIFMRSCGKRI